MSRKLIISSTSGFSKSIIGSLNHKHYELIGFIDKYKSGYHQSHPILGNSIADIKNKDSYYYFIGIGKPLTRKHYLNIVRKHNLRLINIIGKTVILSPDTILDDGISIGKMCILNRNARVHDAVVINTRSPIEHGNEIGCCSNISTNAILNGDASAGEGTLVGSCTVVDGQLKLSSRSTIGSGSAIVRNILSNVAVAGAPARLIRGNEWVIYISLLKLVATVMVVLIL